MANTTPFAPEDFSNWRDWLRSVAKSINLILKGATNNGVTVSLTANAATTTVIDNRIGPSTTLDLKPTTANAAGALATTYQTWPNTTSGQAVLNHANNSQTDRTFRATLEGS